MLLDKTLILFLALIDHLSTPGCHSNPFTVVYESIGALVYERTFTYSRTQSKHVYIISISELEEVHIVGFSSFKKLAFEGSVPVCSWLLCSWCYLIPRTLVFTWAK